MRGFFGRAYQFRLPPPAASSHTGALRRLSIATTNTTRPSLSWGEEGEGASSSSSSPSRAMLLRRLELALKDRRVDEAWAAFDDHKTSHGLPTQALVGGLITTSSYSSDPRRLRRAYDLALAVSKKRSDLLHYDSLARLALTLARAQMPAPAATVLRIMLEKGKSPPMSVWSTVFFHLVKTQIGSYLASDILVELCERFSSRPDSKRSELMRPDATVFNLVLDSCVRFGSVLSARQVVELMPRTGVVADANSIVLVALVYEMNGQRDELKRLKEHVDRASSVLLDRHYRQFYDCLLSLHFKFNDIDAAARLVLDLYERPKSITKDSVFGKPCEVQVGSDNLKMGCKIMIDPKLLRSDFVVEAKSHSGLVVFVDERLVPSNKALSKFINGYVRERRVGELSNLLVSIHKAVGFSEETSLSSDVIGACVELGWLETAHDIVDDMELAGVPVSDVTYTLLLRAYCKQDMMEEAKVLLKQMRNGGLSEENLANPIIAEAETSGRISCLAEFLDREIREDDSVVRSVYEFNSSILFFCKAKMVEDAQKTFRKMQEQKVQPTVQTFGNLINGFSSLEMYREITILWGEIKRGLEDKGLAADRDLFECLLQIFIRGGYFERAMEIVGYMRKHNMYTDKWKYKREFLKFHKDLYRNLNASNARTDVQSRRLEHVRAFRRWVGIDGRS